MGLGGFTRALTMLLIAVAMSTAPALAHERPKKKQADAAQTVPATLQPDATAQAGAGPAAIPSQMGETMEGMDEDRSTMTTFERLLDWLGRLHPTIVHFPIGFFPAALFTAIVGRRRPAFAATVQFLVVASGILAPIAAILGWLDAIGADPDPLLTVHRWLGTAIGIASLPLAIWAWRKPEKDRSAGMIIALSAITAAIVGQAWYGGALVHGVEHLNW